MDKKEVAGILDEIGMMLDLKGENPFKSRAYANAARTLEGLSADLADLVETGDISKIKGIGQALTQKITELVTTGRLKYYDELRASLPPGVLEMLAIPGLGPKKIKVLQERFGIESIGQLGNACLENRLLELEGFGKRSQAKILEGIEYHKRHKGQYLVSFALAEAHKLFQALKGYRKITRTSLAGSLRRQKETVKDIDLVASAKDAEAVMEFFTRLPQVENVIAKGETKSSVLLRTGINADLRIVSDKEFPFALHHFTGGKEHNTAMRNRAKAQGLKLNEYGLFREDTLLSCKDEREIFERLELAFIPPELREGMGEIEAAEKRSLPKLVEAENIRGTFHVHSNYSDGTSTLEEMVQAAQSRGLQYIGISDHSQSAFYARGLKVEDVRRQHEEIDRLNEKYKGFRIFKGIESDILPDGSLDYAEEILAGFDFIIASIHSRFNMPEEQMTLRVCKALSNKHVTMLAHPTGRLLLVREPYSLDLPRVIQTAVAHGVIIEINANPRRLDLDWRMGKFAKESGMLTSINPDAHSVDGFDDIAYGVGIARKSWMEASDVFNTKSLPEVIKYLEDKRNDRPSAGC
jgi:DNA polymerase (family 10)